MAWFPRARLSTGLGGRRKITVRMRYLPSQLPHSCNLVVTDQPGIWCLSREWPGKFDEPKSKLNYDTWEKETTHLIQWSLFRKLVARRNSVFDESKLSTKDRAELTFGRFVLACVLSVISRKTANGRPNFIQFAKWVDDPSWQTVQKTGFSFDFNSLTPRLIHHWNVTKTSASHKTFLILRKISLLFAHWFIFPSALVRVLSPDQLVSPVYLIGPWDGPRTIRLAEISTKANDNYPEKCEDFCYHWRRPHVSYSCA